MYLRSNLTLQPAQLAITEQKNYHNNVKVGALWSQRPVVTVAQGAMKEDGPGWSDWLPVTQYLIISLDVRKYWLLLKRQTVRKLVC